MIRAALYARISKDADGSGLGVARQQDDCKELATKRGWTVVGIYIDNDISAYSGKPRPQYRQMLSDIQAGSITAVVAWHLDRLHRRPTELEEFMDLCDKHHVDLATVQGEIDLGTSSGRLHARLMGAVARHESEHKSERIRRKLLELARDGAYHGGSRPYGYQDDRVTIDPVEAAVVQEAADWIIAGGALYALCVDLNRRGVPTVRGGPWSTQVMHRILTAPRSTGQREHQGKVIGPAKWPGILSASDGARLRAILLDPARRQLRKGPPRRYLLTSLVRCGRCEYRLQGRPNNGHREYACVPRAGRGGCGRIGVKAEPVEALITEAMIARITTPGMAQAINASTAEPSPLSDLHLIEEERTRLDDLARLYADGRLTPREWLVAREPIERRIAQLGNVTIAQSPLGKLAGEGTIRDRWGRLTLEQQLAVIKHFLDAVMIDPAGSGRVFKPGRVRLIWRV